MSLPFSPDANAPTPLDFVFRSACLFGGAGGGAYGLKQAAQRFRQYAGSFELCGAYDFDAYACSVYEYLTGSAEAQLDATTVTVEDIRRLLGEKAPDLVFLSPPCLPADGLVLTPIGPRRIDSLRAGHLVLTHRGRYRRVLAVGRHEYEGTMYGVRLAGTVDVQEFTAEHPLYVRRFWRPVVGDRQKLTMGDPQFMNADRVRKGDLIGFPVDQEVEGTAVSFVDSFELTTDVTVSPHKRRSRTGVVHDHPTRTRPSGRLWDLRPWATSKILWFVLGAYIGDGYVREERNETIFCVGAADGELATRLRAALKALGLNFYDSTENGPNNIKIHVAAKHLCNVAKAFGMSCETKRIPEVLFNLERPLVESLIDGYRAADGSDKKSPNGKDIWKIPSVSLDLLRGTQRMLLRLGLWGAIHIAAKAGTTVIEGRTVQTSDRWELSVQEKRDKRGPATFLEDGCVWVRVREVKLRHTKEPVWNLEVEEDNTFCVPMMATHNCKGSSKLLSSAKAATEKYVAMNDLSYRGVLTLLDAYPDDPIGLLLFENVPNITTRAKNMLAELRRLLRSRGYVLHDGFHEARHIGNLAQRRKRWFMVARHPSRVPVLLYRPPHQPGLVCGDVLGELPLPNDPRGGPMHKLSDTSFINLLRLWKIPAGQDWRALIKDGRPTRERFRRHHVERWEDPSITVAGSGSNGPCAVADPRTETEVDLSRGWSTFHHVDYVTPWNGVARTITAGLSPSNGAISIADHRIELGRARPGYTSMDHVLAWDSVARTITGATRPGNGAPSIAQPLDLLGGAAPTADEQERWEREGERAVGRTQWFDGAYAIGAWDEPTRTVVGGASPTNGASFVADPRPLNLLGGTAPSAEALTRWEREGVRPDGAVGWFKGKYGINAWGEPTRTVIGGEANGASYVADPRALDLELPPGTFHHVNRVTPWDDATGTITHAPAPSSGAPAVADIRIPLDGAAPVLLAPPSQIGPGRWDVFSKHYVTPWCGVTRAVICGEGNGATAVADVRIELLGGADPAPRFKGSLGVLGADDASGTVTAEAAPSTGRFAYAAPIPPDLRPQAGNEALHWGKYVVVPWNDAAPTVTGASRVGSGAVSVADRRIDLATARSTFHQGSGPGRWGVLTPLVVSGTVTSNARLHTGPFSYAARAPEPINLVPQADCYDAGYGVLAPTQPARTIAATAAVGCGAYAIADDVPQPIDLTPEGVENNPERAARYGVLRLDQAARTITATTRVGCGAFSIAAHVPQPIDLVPRAGVDLNHNGRYGVLGMWEPSRTITATSEVGCGAYAVADPLRLYLGCEPHAGAYGVLRFDGEAATITGHHKLDNRPAAVADPRPAPPPYVVLSCEETQRIVDGEVQVPFAIVDPDFPDEPLAIVDDLKRPPFRWVEERSKRGKVTRRRETVAVVLISEDGTWHRPLTTLELAVLQAFPWLHNGTPLDFGGGTTAQREAIGNAVPPAVAKAMGEQMLLSLLISRTVGFALGDPGTPVWVKNLRALERQLRREGYFVAKGRKPMNFTTGETIDDGASIWRRRPPKAKKRKDARRRAARPHQIRPQPRPTISIGATIQ